MDMTPGRAIYNPDENLKPLRQPKTIRPEGQAISAEQEPLAHRQLSASAHEFVPRFGVVGGNALQERLQRHQQQYIQETYHNYQPQQQQQQQQYNNHQPYNNGYGQQQQQQLMTQINSMNINNGVQDRLHISNNSRGGGGGGGGAGGASGSDNNGGNGSGNSTFYQYPQNQTSYHHNYNKHHHNNHHHNNHHQSQFNNHHNYQHQHRQNHYHNQQQQQQQQQQHQQQQNYQEQQSNQSASGGDAYADVSEASAGADDMQNIALDYLQTVIPCLNENPGKFDSIATRFITIFDGMENNHYVLSIAMEDIFKESIKNPNFRYMGAKLYNLLHNLNPQKDSLFHTFLKCKLNFHQNVIRGYMEGHQEGKVRETALFLAELYMQLRGDDSRIYLIAENIVYSLKQLLEHVVNENVRCICLTLKLAGYDLSTDCPEEMKEIIAKLDLINCENPGKYPLASNVIALQKNNWGRKVSGSESLGDPETSKPPEPPRVSDDPVFYGPDGREITAEECEFLTNGTGGANNGGGSGSTDNEEDNELEDLDPEMDEETERDYRLFLKQANNS